jgi:acetyl esterase/lipase
MIDEVIDRVRGVYGSWRRDTPLAKMREDWDALFSACPIAAALEPACAGGVDAVWVTAAHTDADRVDADRVAADRVDADRVVLYFHGGGYKLGSTRSHRDLMTRISAAAHCRVLGLDYRLAPEHIFPAPVDDALAAYEWLLEQGIAAERIAVAGDSAGGGLAAALLLRLRERLTPMPAAAVMLSAWTDLTAQSESFETRAALDPIHQRGMILATARTYLGAHGDPGNPLASPLYGDLRGLPPVLLQVGGRETVLDDSTRFAHKARAAGVDVQLEVYDDMIHVFQQFADDLPEGGRAIESIGRFLRDAWARRASVP